MSRRPIPSHRSAYLIVNSIFSYWYNVLFRNNHSNHWSKRQACPEQRYTNIRGCSQPKLNGPRFHILQNSKSVVHVLPRQFLELPFRLIDIKISSNSVKFSA
ncbi:hypothetical protein TSMEX_008455 [Taenia solium]|eukprot:TsM_000351600 transcript=TsM_000351600 gene=TsM_000351600